MRFVYRSGLLVLIILSLNGGNFCHIQALVNGISIFSDGSVCNYCQFFSFLSNWIKADVDTKLAKWKLTI